MVILFALDSQAQTPTPSPAPSSPSCAAPATCPKAAPQELKVKVFYKEGDQPWTNGDTVRPLARKRFFLSTCPFDLDKVANLGQPPARQSYYRSVNASPKLINWLEANNCDTVYCRELRSDEVTCKVSDTNNCVPEFVKAYEEALRHLKNEGLARKWITNYAPLSSPKLSAGFYEEKRKWFEGEKGVAGAIRKLEERAGLPAGSIKSAMTDRDGVAYFYDLCPGTYYISSIAAIEIDGAESILWETVSFHVGEVVFSPEEGSTTPTVTPNEDSSTPTAITLANVLSIVEDDNNYSHFAGKKVTKSISSVDAGRGMPVGQ